MGSACSMNWKKRNVYRIFVGKPEGKRPLGRPKCRLVSNIKMDLSVCCVTPCPEDHVITANTILITQIEICKNFTNSLNCKVLMFP
jgi:hypothetical protein